MAVADANLFFQGYSSFTELLKSSVS